MSRGIAASIAITASVGAGIIHLALGPEHLEELGALGGGFYLAALLQVGWAVAALGLVGHRASTDAGRRRLAFAGIAINVAILGAWAVSRTWGLPAGEVPWMPEPIGRPDAMAAALEIAIIAAILVRRPARQPDRWPGPTRRVRLATVLALLVISAGTAGGLMPDGAHAANHAAMTEASGVAPAETGDHDHGATGGHDHAP